MEVGSCRPRLLAALHDHRASDTSITTHSHSPSHFPLVFVLHQVNCPAIEVIVCCNQGGVATVFILPMNHIGVPSRFTVNTEAHACWEPFASPLIVGSSLSVFFFRTCRNCTWHETICHINTGKAMCHVKKLCVMWRSYVSYELQCSCWCCVMWLTVKLLLSTAIAWSSSQCVTASKLLAPKLNIIVKISQIVQHNWPKRRLPCKWYL